jgi:hypothetical protein
MVGTTICVLARTLQLGSWQRVCRIVPLSKGTHYSESAPPNPTETPPAPRWLQVDQDQHHTGRSKAAGCVLAVWPEKESQTPMPASTARYIIGTQVYGRLYLKKRNSPSLHKRAFPKALDGICQRATLSL